jgi:hypothetical protein
VRLDVHVRLYLFLGSYEALRGSPYSREVRVLMTFVHILQVGVRFANVKLNVIFFYVSSFRRYVIRSFSFSLIATNFTFSIEMLAITTAGEVLAFAFSHHLTPIPSHRVVS